MKVKVQVTEASIYEAWLDIPDLHDLQDPQASTRIEESWVLQDQEHIADTQVSLERTIDILDTEIETRIEADPQMELLIQNLRHRLASVMERRDKAQTEGDDKGADLADGEITGLAIAISYAVNSMHRAVTR